MISQEIMNFSLYLSVKSLLQNLTFAPTNTLTNTAIARHRTGQHRVGFPRPALLFLLVFEIIFVSFALSAASFWRC